MLNRGLSPIISQSPIAIIERVTAIPNTVRVLFLYLLWNHDCLLDAIPAIIWNTAYVIPKYCSGKWISVKILLLKLERKDKILVNKE